MRKLPLALFALALAAPAAAAGGNLAVEASRATVAVGESFTVEVMASSDAEVNAADIVIAYPPAFLEAVSVSSLGVVTIPIENYIGKNGTAVVQGGIYPAKKLAADRIAAISFRAVAPGKAEIGIGASSALYLNDGLGTAVSPVIGKTVVVVQSPAGPANVPTEPLPAANLPAGTVGLPLPPPPPAEPAVWTKVLSFFEANDRLIIAVSGAVIVVLLVFLIFGVLLRRKNK